MSMIETLTARSWGLLLMSCTYLPIRNVVSCFCVSFMLSVVDNRFYCDIFCITKPNSIIAIIHLIMTVFTHQYKQLEGVAKFVSIKKESMIKPSKSKHM